MEVTSRLPVFSIYTLNGFTSLRGLERTQTIMPTTALIFDMDGVLIDSEPAHKLAKERAFARFGVTLPESVYEQYKGRPDATFMNEVVPSISQ